MSAQRRNRKRSRGGGQGQQGQQGQQPNQQQGQRGHGNVPQAADLWRAVPPVELPEPITPAVDPTALLRSLGTPPLPGQQAVADHYLAAVVERSAHLATALAAAADLLELPADG